MIKHGTVQRLRIDNVDVELTRKRVKNLNLRVTNAQGPVHVSAPSWARSADIQAFVRANAAWIDTARARLLALSQARAQSSLINDGSTLFYLGQPRPLQLVPASGKCVLAFEGGAFQLRCRSDSSQTERNAAIDVWYRQQLQAELTARVPLWSQRSGLVCGTWRIRKMRTRWGSCNPRSRNLNFSLELIKYPEHCLDYVIVHELAHLLEYRHNRRFYDIVASVLPTWKEAEQRLRQPLNDTTQCGADEAELDAPPPV